MSGERGRAAASAVEAIEATDAAPSPFTMVTGDPAAMVCEGDVCFVPGSDPAA